MWADGVVVILVFPEQEFEVAFAESHEMVQAFMLDCLHEPFRVGVEVGRSERELLHLDSFALENLVEYCGELGVAVLQEIGDLFALLGQVHCQVTCLLLHPRAGRVARHPSDSHPPRGDVDEKQHVKRHLPANGPDVLGEEVAGPKGFHVAFHERGPVALGAPRRRVKAITDQDFLDRVDGHVDSELLQLTADPGVAPAGFTGHAQDDRGDVLRDRGTSRFAFWLFRVHSIPFFPDPPQERFIVNDPEKFLDRAAQRRAKTNQKRAFGGGGLDGFREPGSENGVLGFQVGDLAQQDGLRHVNEECEKRVVTKIGHRKKPKRMANQPIFGYGNLSPGKNGYADAARERNNVFAYRRNPH